MFSWELFTKAPIIGILRHFSSEETKNILENYAKGGLSTIEITMNTEGASSMIKDAVRSFGDTLNIGAGTVCSEKDLEAALEAGAAFIVTPIINEKVIEKANKSGVPIFPGAFTPTEIYKAWSLGGSMIKVFPATFFGPDYLKEIKAPLNHIKLVATGGVNLQNIITFFEKGADGVGMGSQLFPKEFIENSNWPALQAHFKMLFEKYKEYKNLLK